MVKLRHSELVNAVLKRVQSAFPDARAFRVETGATPSKCPLCGNDLRVIKYGVNGSCDIRGYLPGGRGFEIECKVGRDVMRPDQLAWKAMCEKLGVIHIVARDPADAVRALNCAQNPDQCG